MPSHVTTEFLAVDLDVESTSSLGPLSDALAHDCLEISRFQVGRAERIAFQTARLVRTAEATIRALLRSLNGLPASARRSWRAARVRDFNIGIQAEPGPPSFFELAVTPATLREVAALGARIVVTVYAPPARRSALRSASASRRGGAPTCS